MNEPRFYCPDLAAGVVTLDDTETRHAVTSLRLRPGDSLVLFDGRGRIGQARLLPPESDLSHPDDKKDRLQTGPTRRGKAHGKSLARVSVDAVLNVPPPAHQLTLIVAAAKGPRLDWMVEKCTELGVDRLFITAFERSIVRPDAQAADRLTRVAIAACKQSRRAWLPQVRIAKSLLTALAADESRRLDDSELRTLPNGLVVKTGPERRLLVAELEGTAYLAAWLHGHGPLTQQLAVVIGPEGGLTDAERESLRIAGGETVRLAEHVLRTETAAICVAANWAARAHQ